MLPAGMQKSSQNFCSCQPSSRRRRAVSQSRTDRRVSGISGMRSFLRAIVGWRRWDFSNKSVGRQAGRQATSNAEKGVPFISHALSLSSIVRVTQSVPFLPASSLLSYSNLNNRQTASRSPHGDACSPGGRRGILLSWLRDYQLANFTFYSAQ